MTSEIIKNDFVLRIWLKSLQYKTVYMPILICFPVGILLNSLSIFLFTKKKFKNENYGFLSIINCIHYNIMAVIIFIISILILIKGELTTINHEVLVYFLLNLFNELPSWLNLIIAVDKILSLKRADTHFKFKNKKLIFFVALCGIYLIILCTHIPSFQNIRFENSSNAKNISKNFDNDTIQVDDLVVILRMLVPSLLILVANIIFLIRLVQLKIHYRVINDRFMAKKLDVIFSVISVDFIYMIGLFLKILLFLFFLLDNSGLINLDDKSSVLYLYSYVYVTFFNINMNFFVYVSVCSHFRNEFREIFFSRIKKIKVKRVRTHFTFIIYLDNHP